MDESLKFDYSLYIFQGEDEDGNLDPDLSGLSNKIGLRGKSINLFN